MDRADFEYSTFYIHYLEQLLVRAAMDILKLEFELAEAHAAPLDLSKWPALVKAQPDEFDAGKRETA